MSAGASPIPDEVLRLFDNKLRLGHMATRRPDGELAVVPVGVVIHDGMVRISSPTDTYKVRNLNQDPHIAVCVMDPGDGRRYLMIRGKAELADDVDKQFLNWLARTHMGQGEHPTQSPRTVITIKAARFVMGGVNSED